MLKKAPKLDGAWGLLWLRVSSRPIRARFVSKAKKEGRTSFILEIPFSKTTMSASDVRSAESA